MPVQEREIKLILEIQSNERFAKLFLEECTTKIIVLSEKEVYIFNKEFKYYQIVKNNGLIMNLISEVLHRVLEQWLDKYQKDFATIVMNKELDKDEKDMLKDNTKKLIKNVFTAIKNIESTTFMTNIIKQVLVKATLSPDQQTKLNRLDNYLNFRNCKLNLKTLDYADRNEDDFVTEYLDYDFKPKADKEIKKYIKSILLQICNNDINDYNFIMSYLGYCITSETKEQTYLNVVGPSASNGKSTLIKMMESVFSIYTFKSDRRTFSETFGKQHKYFASMKNKRIVYIEELDKNKMNGELLKDTVDGNKINNEVLFGTNEEIQIMFKLLFFSNNLMNFDSDSGIKRRMITLYFNSKFVDAEDYDREVVSYTNGSVFLKDKKLLTKFDDDEFKNAFVHIIISKAKEYFDNGIVVPDKYKQITTDLCEENDKMMTFIENNLDKTNDTNDIIAKDEFKNLYNAYTKCNHAWTTVLSDIKRCNLTYNKDRWGVANGIKSRGVIVGLKKKSVNDLEFVSETHSLPDPNGLDYYRIPCTTLNDDELLKRYIDIEKELNDTKHHFEIMRLEFEAYKLSHPHVEVKVKVEEEEVNFIDFDDMIEKAPVVVKVASKKAGSKLVKK